MTSSYHSDIEQLKKLTCEGRAIIISGTGVSIAASIDPESAQPDPQASWVGLLKHDGLHWLQQHRFISEAELNAHMTFLDNPASKTNKFIAMPGVRESPMFSGIY